MNRWESAMVGFMIGGVIGIVIMDYLTVPKEDWQSQAVAHGAAEWVVYQKTGNTTFKWKERK